MPGLSHWQHPRFFGYFPSNASLGSVLGDYLSTGLGVLGLSWQASPALTELEEVVTDWVRQMVGLSEAWSGVIQDTASTCTLLALVCARERTTSYCLARGGLQSEPQPLIVYTSDQSHSSVEKAALLAGFGRDNVRKIAHDAAYAMRGRPRCSRPRGPLSGSKAVRHRRHDRHDDVDSARSGRSVGPTGARPRTLAPRGRRHGGVGDDLAGVPVDVAGNRRSGFAGPQSPQMARHGLRLFSLLCSRSRAPGARHVDEPELSPIVGRRPREEPPRLGNPPGPPISGPEDLVLAGAEGVAGLQARLRRDLENAKWLADQVRSAQHWRILAPIPLQTLCVRHEPPGLEGEALDKHTLAWSDRINRSGKAYLTPAILDGRWMVRVSIGAEQTARQDVEALWRLMRRGSGEMCREMTNPSIQYGLIKISACVFAGNTASARVLEKCGFEPEGYLRKHYLKDGRYLDSRLYALLK